MRPVVDAFGARVGASAPAVACVCPTMDRPEVHESLYRTFAAQDYPNKRLYVLDEGATTSSFFPQLGDPRVMYMHAPSPRGEVTRIGSARNKLMSMVGEPLVAHLDDDDAYAPSYLSTMIGKLLGARADVAKLAVFNNLHGDQVYQWDVRQMGGTHYALKGGETPAKVDVPKADPTFADAMMLGFGFSYVFQRSAWDRVKFPAEGTEDYPWMRDLRQLGAKILHVADYPEGVLHVVHEKSASVLFPQRFLGSRRQLGLGASPSGMTELPAGQDLQLQPGVKYAVVASVKKKHTLKALAARCASWGIALEQAQDNVSAADYGVTAPSGDYRLVYATATAKAPTRMPWKVPSPLSWFDGSSCLRAWSGSVVRSSPMVGSRPPFPALGANVLPVTPMLVLQYRSVWNAYVLATAQAAVDCASAWQAQHDGTQPQTPINLQQFAVAPDATTLQLWANSQTETSASILADWNAYAGWSDAQVVLNAAAILQSYQATVLKCGQFWQPSISKDCPSLPMPQPPGISIQQNVIGEIQGAGILATGLLQLLGIGASGALEAIGSVASAVDKKTDKALDILSSPFLWTAVAAVGAAVVAVEIGPELIHAWRQRKPVQKTASEAVRKSRRLAAWR